jgi:catechol O-methyltransferase
MMNLGPEKGEILKSVFEKYKPKRILELGGYCGYSSLVFSYLAGE